jgi:hypothetical protein
MTDKLETELAALRARVAELEARANPPAPPKFEAGTSGPTTTDLALSRISMSPEVMAEMVRAVGNETIRGIVKSGGVGVLQSTATTPSPTRVSAQYTSGWRDPGPLGPPPGVAIADRLMDVQDARDRAQLIANEARRLAKK